MAIKSMWIGSPIHNESDAIPTYSDSSLQVQRLRQDFGGTITDSGYLSFPMNAAVSNDFARYGLDAFDAQFDSLNSIRLRVRFRFLGWTSDTTNANFYVEPVGESGIQRSVAASTAAWQTLDYTDTVPNPSFNNLDDSSNWQFFWRTSGYSGATDTITMEIASVQVDIDYTPRVRGCNITSVTAVQSETGTAEVNFSIGTLPSSKQRKIIFFESGDSATQTVTAKYNGTGGTAFTAINDGAVPTIAMDSNYYMNVSYYDVPNSETGSKSIYWTPRPNAGTARAWAMVLEYADSGAPFSGTYLDNETYSGVSNWDPSPSITLAGRGVMIGGIFGQSTIAAAGRPVMEATASNQFTRTRQDTEGGAVTAWFEAQTGIFGVWGWQMNDDTVALTQINAMPQDKVTGSRIASNFAFYIEENQAFPNVTDVDTDEQITADQLNVVATGTNLADVTRVFVDGKEQSIDSTTDTTVQFDAVDYAEGDTGKYGSVPLVVAEPL